MTSGSRATPIRVAAADPALQAVVTVQTPLLYAVGADPRSDRPAHVRAGSSLAHVPGGLAVIQDDAAFIAIIDATGRVGVLELPAANGQRQFDDRRGNKSRKLDLEACVCVESGARTLLMAFGSGSSPLRRRIALVEWTGPGAPAISLIDADALYDELAAATEFAGTQLNIEGAIRVRDRLRLFGRGNGRAAKGLRALNATCDLELAAVLEYVRAPSRRPPPPPGNIVQYELGSIDGVALGFTDAAAWLDRVLYVASAELTVDATVDGPVAGSVVGVISEDGESRWCRLTDDRGLAFAGKAEGVAVSESPDRLSIVIDADDPDAPSLLCAVELRGPWTAYGPKDLEVPGSAAALRGVE